MVRPQSQFVYDLSKTELELLSRIVRQSGYTVAELQFYLKDSISDEDWPYLEALARQRMEYIEPPRPHIIKRFVRWFSQNL